MATASGVYWTLTDNSIEVDGSSSFEVIVPMLTVKGEVGKLNRVTASTYQDVIGYDLSYNPNYLGLQKMLANIDYLDVLRLNSEPTCGNVCDSDGELDSIEGITDDMDLSDVGTTFAIRTVNSGAYGNRYVRVRETVTSTKVSVPDIAVDDGTLAIVGKAVTNQDMVTAGYAIALPFGIGQGCHTRYNDEEYRALLYDSNGDLLAAIKDDDLVYQAVKDEVGETVIGLLVDNSMIYLDASQITFSGSYFTFTAWDADTKLWTMSYAKMNSEGTAYSELESTDFSTYSDSDLYYTGVDFGELALYLADGVSSPNFDLLEDYVLLDNASNGSLPYASDIDLSCFKTSSANVVVLNGLTTDISIINKIAEACESNLKSFFIGAPDFESYTSVADWAESLYATEYSQLVWICDHEETSAGTIQICPSVSLFNVYANMYSDYGCLNYPPAGKTYGVVSVSNLTETDATSYMDELKTNNINWQRVLNGVSCLWEQKTRYSLNSDLSYANTVFILRDLREQIMTLAENYNFRYSTASMLTTFESGLTSILDTFVSNGFLSTYTLSVPSFEEAQAAGRTLTIGLAVSVMQDAEVIKFDVVLENYSA